MSARPRAAPSPGLVLSGPGENAAHPAVTLVHWGAAPRATEWSSGGYDGAEREAANRVLRGSRRCRGGEEHDSSYVAHSVLVRAVDHGWHGRGHRVGRSHLLRCDGLEPGAV